MGANLSPEMQRLYDERVKQVIIGVSIIVVLTLVVSGSLLGWRHLPGLFGEWVGAMIGIVTTPFFMEATFAILGLTIVMALNHWRQHKEGDELVYLEQISAPDTPENLPEHAKWAIYREQPLDGEAPSLLAQAEGAFAIGDYQATSEWIGEMNQDELKQPETLRLRLELANATDHPLLAEQLEKELRQS